MLVWKDIVTEMLGFGVIFEEFDPECSHVANSRHPRIVVCRHPCRLELPYQIQ
jgi:hypothetical protein